MAKRTSTAAKPRARAPERPVAERVDAVIAWLKAHGTKATLDGMARYALPSDRAFGVAMKDLKALGKELGRDHALALGLWDSGWYEARMLTAFVADPSALTPAQMDRWCKDFDNWAYGDHLAFHLFDRTPHAWAKVEQWSRKKGELERRAGFALLWALALHDQRASDAQFVEALGWIERAAEDDRNFVKKAVNMALRAIGNRRPSLTGRAEEVATRLAASSHPSARWIGKDALRSFRAR